MYESGLDVLISHNEALLVDILVLKYVLAPVPKLSVTVVDPLATTSSNP